MADLEITVNGETVAASPGELVIAACERAGVYIPRFCYHPRMKPVGMCRMCLVNIDTGRGPALLPSCMIAVSPNMVVETEAPNVKKAQDGVLEFLLINHPLDCPVCDKGGECPLQDQTMSYGPGESRYVEEKRHFEKPIPISDLVYLDRERCILCDRCTRFAKEVAGDPLIHFMNRGNQTEVNTFPDDPFASYFSGNTVQICPVGALTGRPYRFKARPWDLEETESTATIDSVGSRIAVQSSRNVVLRYLGIDSNPVNWGWLSDKERFSFEAFNSDARLTDPLMRGDSLGKHHAQGDQLVRATWSQALGAAALALAETAPAKIGVIGGARLTNESAYAWAKLLKGVIGTDNVDCQLDDGLPAEVVLSLPRATIADATAKGGVIILLGPDPKEDLGSLFLRLRHALVNDAATLIELTPRASGLARLARHRLHPRPGEVAAVAAALCAPADATAEVGGVSAAAINAARAALAGDRPVTVVLGRASLAEAAGFTVDAALALAGGLPRAKFLSALRRGNVHGAIDMGLSPGLLPGRVGLINGRDAYRERWPQIPAERGLDARGILQAAAAGELTTLVLLGADPLNDCPDRALAEAALASVETVIAVDLFINDSVERAHIVLPAAAPTETDGTFTNLEGRLSPIRQKVTPPGTARADWIIAADLAYRLEGDLGFTSVREITDEIAALSPRHGHATAAALDESGTDGVLVSGGLEGFTPPAPTTADTRADAYSYWLVSTREMYDNGVLLAHSPSSAHLARGARLLLNPADHAKLGVSSHKRAKVSNARGALVVPVVADAGVPVGVAAIAFNQPDLRVAKLIDTTAAVTQVRIEQA